MRDERVEPERDRSVRRRRGGFVAREALGDLTGPFARVSGLVEIRTSDLELEPELPKHRCAPRRSGGQDQLRKNGRIHVAPIGRKTEEERTHGS